MPEMPGYKYCYVLYVYDNLDNDFPSLDVNPLEKDFTRQKIKLVNML